MNTTSQKPHKQFTPTRRVKKPAHILAVDPGSRYMGMAFLIGTDLIRADVENLREAGMRSQQIVKKVERVLRWWIAHYEPEILVIESAVFAQKKRSSTVQRLITTIAAVGRQEGLRVEFYPPTRARKFVCQQGRPTRLATARIISTDYYPWLQPYYEKEANRSWWQQRYWTVMFDAIAVGLACHGKRPDVRSDRQAA